MHDLSKRINQQYGQKNLAEEILVELARAGKNIDALAREDLVTFEEFHLRGRNATRELAQLAGLQPGMRVLDVGSGVGGPARNLVEEFGCHLTGIDIVWNYCRAAHVLNARSGFGSRIAIYCAHALAAPFASDAFDVVWMQHVSMNIEDKQSLINEFWRILRPGGRLALYEILAGPKELANFPLPWANTPAISFLADPDQLRSMLGAIGFSLIHWKDVTARTLDWGRRALRWRPDVPPPLGLDLVIGQNAAQKAANLLRNLEESRISLVQVVAERQS